MRSSAFEDPASIGGAPALRARPASPWAKWAVVLGMAVTLAPVLTVAVPPLVDYPNHLARAVYLSRGAASHLADVYDIVWQNLPNLGTDVLLMGLVGIVSPALAGRIFIGFVLLVLMAGIVLYARVAFGRWTWWSAVGSLAAFNGTFLFGFLSFNLACGEALLLAAAWRALRPNRPWLASMVLALGSAIIWFTHIGGLIFAVVLCGAAELAPFHRRETWHEFLPRMGSILLLVLPALIVIGVLALTSAFTQVGGPTYVSLSTKPYQFYLAFASYRPWLDIPPWILTVVLFGLCAMRGRLVFDRPAAIAIVLCLGLFVVSPLGAKGATWIATRFAVMTSLLCFGGFLPEPRTRGAMAVSGLVVVAVALRIVGITSIWIEEDGRVAVARQALACLAPASKLAVYAWPLDGTGPIRPRIAGITLALDPHVGAWSVTDRDATWVNLFALEGQQPIRLRDSFRPLIQPTYLTQSLGLIVDHAANGSMRLSPAGQRFDAILVVHAEGAVIPPIEGLHPVWGTGYARLLSVDGRGIDQRCAGQGG